MEKNNITVQDWLPIEKVFDNGIILSKNNKYIKIMKITPINFNLKSDFEKEAILNSYKIFLKTCNFDIQIFIQSSKENLENNINYIKKNLEEENKDYLNEIAEDYFDFIKKFNSIKNSSTKNFYIIISNEKEENQEIVFQELNEKYFKIKESLFRCGNYVIELNYEEIKELFKINLNSRIYLK